MLAKENEWDFDKTKTRSSPQSTATNWTLLIELYSVVLPLFMNGSARCSLVAESKHRFFSARSCSDCSVDQGSFGWLNVMALLGVALLFSPSSKIRIQTCETFVSRRHMSLTTLTRTCANSRNAACIENISIVCAWLVAPCDRHDTPFPL